MDSIHLLNRRDGKWLMELYSARRRQTFNVWASIFTQERPWNQPFLVQGSEESNNHGKTAGYQTALPNKDNYSRIEDGELAIGCLFKTDHLPLPMIGSVLQRLLEVIMRYFGETFDKILLTLSGGPLAAQALIMVCEEFINAGYPFITEPSLLTQLVSPPSLLGQLMQTVTGTTSIAETLPPSMLTNTPWRRMQPQYPANEIYIEQLERISAILSGSDGSVLRDGSLVTGEMWVDSRLNGAAPDVVLNLFNGQLIEDCDFHPCVRRLRFLRDRTLAFVPPDRRCRLMRYSCTSNNVISPPVSALASISYSSTEGKIDFVVLKQRKGVALIDGIVIKMRLPDYCCAAQLQTSAGTSFHFDSDQQLLTWNVGRYPETGKQPRLTGTFQFQPGHLMNRVCGVEADLEFTAHHLAVSGMRPERLLICGEQQQYQTAFKAFKSTSRSGQCTVRFVVSRND